jgi:PAS domain S-box-containing protein
MMPVMCESPTGVETLTSGAPRAGGVSDENARSLRRLVADLVLETTSSCIWLIDADGRTTFVNAHALKLLGYSEEEMLGRPALDLVEEEQRPAALARLMRRRQGATDRIAVQMRRKDGRRIWVMSAADPVFNRQGEYAGALAVFTDLTAEKESEARLSAEIEILSRQLRDRDRDRDRRDLRLPVERPARIGIGGLISVGIACGAFIAVATLAAAGNIASSVAFPSRVTGEDLDR